MILSGNVDESACGTILRQMLILKICVERALLIILAFSYSKYILFNSFKNYMSKIIPY